MKKLNNGWVFELARFLILSNGHGEDLSGSLIGRSLQENNQEVNAFPIVGYGSAYHKEGIKTIGKTREFTTGGIGYTSLVGRLTEIFQGQLFYLISRCISLINIVKEYDCVVVVGDVVPVTLAWLTRRPVFVYLVAYSSHYEGHLSLPWPCGLCLKSSNFIGVCSRDKFTAEDLSSQLYRKVEFLGNPFMDAVLAMPVQLNLQSNNSKKIGLIPGSRRPELDSNICLMLRVIDILSNQKTSFKELIYDMALVSSMDNQSLTNLATKEGWNVQRSHDIAGIIQLSKNQSIINIHRNSFSEVLHKSDILLSMSGTAAEQAIGISKPVVQLLGHGPQFTPSFAEAQRRLLGPTIFCAKGRPGELENLNKTSYIILDLLYKLQDDLGLRRECHLQAYRRLGEKGGSKRISEKIVKLSENL